MSSVSVTALKALAPAHQPVEIVERKGLGHPDSICDALAEELSRRLCTFYLDRFGLILHHNVDKALLWGGASQTAFGGGHVTEPIEIFLSGRATAAYKGVTVPIEELAAETCDHWLRSQFHALDPDRHVKIHCLIRPGSADLVELYERENATGVALANDTSCAVGYAPLDDLERVVLAAERHLNSPALKETHPEIGQDIKVMGVRRGEAIELTLACAFVDRHISDLEDYIAKKQNVAHLAQEAAGQITRRPTQVQVNTADDEEKGSLYLTVTGTSAEAGDDGEVGRGNRVNGLITPYRPMNMEAAAGKNPVTHIGKLYNIAAQRIADDTVRELPAVEEAYCYLVSRIGHPIQEPQVADVHVRLKEGDSLDTVASHVEAIVSENLARMNTIRDELVAGSLRVY